MPSPPRRRRALLVLMLLSVVLLALPDSFQAPLRGAVLDLLAPVLSPLDTAWDGARRWLARRLDAGSDRRLMDEVLSLQGMLAEGDAERISLRRQLRAASELAPALRASHRILAGRVIGSDAVRWRRSLVLDRGAEDGVRPGHVAVCGQALVGRIASVGRHASRVQGLADPDCRIWVLLGRGDPERPDGGRIQGVAQGGPGGRLRLVLCDRAALVRTGDLVQTSGYDERYPAGLWVGRVSKVEGEGGEGAEVEISPASDLDGLEEVQILLPAGGE